MTLQVFQSSSLCFCNKLCIQILIASDKRHIHQRTVFLANRALEQLALVEVVVEDGSLFFVPLLDGFQSAHLLQPLEYLAANVNAICRRCIIQGLCVCLCLPFQHGRGVCNRCFFRNQVVPNNHDDNTSRANVLLNAAPDDTVLGNINRFAQEAGRNVCNQRLTLGVREGLELCTINGIVFTNINIICIWINRQIGAIRNVREGFIFGRCNLHCLSVLLCFLISFLCPLTRYNVICNAIFHQVHRDCGELLRCTTLQKQNSIIIWNVHQIS